LNIGYPLSRLPHPLLHWMAFPIKEVVYRLTRPRLVDNPTAFPVHPLTGEKILLVDDTASSGKTLKIAFDFLITSGAHAKDIRVAVGRAGQRVRSLLDASVN
jgi:hypoxanthine phosphoribosyltransferase